MSVNVAEVFGQDVFNEAVMKERLPEVTYKQMVKLMEEGGDVTLELADIVAKAMKEWAIEKGATHYTHIFQPYIVSIGAEKHDSCMGCWITGLCKRRYPLYSDCILCIHR